MDVFSTDLKVEDLYTILDNKDLESIMEVEPPIRMIWSPNQQIPTKSQAISKSLREKPFEEIKTLQPKCVKSVGGIRQNFELEQLAKWPPILERKDNFFFQLKKNNKKLNLKEVLQPVLNENTPLTRLSWKIMCELNAKSLKYRKQFMQCPGGKNVLLSGSLGGRIEIYKQPITRHSLKKKTKTLNKTLSLTKKELLNSLRLSFKPGPLNKKIQLIDTHINKNNGIEVVHLPSVGIEVFPQLGVRLDSAVCARLEQSRQPDGLMDASWAMFAASAVKESGKETQSMSCTFQLPYKNNQSKVLMQRDPDMYKQKEFSKVSCSSNDVLFELNDLESNSSFLHNYHPSDQVEKIVKGMLFDMIKTTALGAIQDSIGEIDTIFNSKLQNNEQTSKLDSSKTSKRKYSELRRLDVTVIDVSNNNDSKLCCNDFCKLGCVCASLQSPVILNEHCGQPECMFKCKCQFNENSHSYSTNKEIAISEKAVFNLQNQINRFLSREEQKFRRTVIHANDNTIVLGASSRSLRKPKKLENFLSSDDSVLSSSSNDCKVVLEKLPKSLHLEPWCMAHQLYKCFCKNKLSTGHKYKFSYLQDNSSDSILNESFNEFESSKKNDLYETCSRTIVHSSKKKGSKGKCIVSSEKNKRLMEPSRKEETEDFLKLEKDASQTSSVENILCHEEFKLPDENSLSKSEAKKPKKLTPLNCKMIKLVKNYCVSNEDKNQWFMQPPVHNLRKVLCWNFFLTYFNEGKVNVWASKSPPYKLYATLDTQFKLSDLCFNIKNPDFLNQNWNLYPPILVQILLKNYSACKFILLIGRNFAWQISGIVNPIISQNNNKNSEKSSDKNFSEKMYTLPQILRVQGSHQLTDNQNITNLSKSDSNSPLELWKLLPNQPNASNLSQIETQVLTSAHNNVFKTCPSPELSDEMESQPENREDHNDLPFTLPIHKGKFNRWLLLTLENDFLTLKIISRGVTVLYSNLIIGIHEACLQKKIVRVKGVEVTNADDVFQIYGIPNSTKKQVCMGPFKKDEKANLQIVSNGGSQKSGKHTQGIWLYNKIGQQNIFLSKKPALKKKVSLLKNSIPSTSTFKSCDEKVALNVNLLDSNNDRQCAEQLSKTTNTSNSDQLSPEKKIVILKGKQFILKKVVDPVKKGLQNKIVNILKVHSNETSLLNPSIINNNQQSELQHSTSPNKDKGSPVKVSDLSKITDHEKIIPEIDTTKSLPNILSSNQRRKQNISVEVNPETKVSTYQSEQSFATSGSTEDVNKAETIILKDSTTIKDSKSKEPTPKQSPVKEKEKLMEYGSQSSGNMQNEIESIDELHHPTLPHSYVLKYLTKLEGEIKPEDNDEEEMPSNKSDDETSDDDVIYLPQKQEIVEVLDSDDEETYAEERLDEEDLYDEERLDEEFLNENTEEEDNNFNISKNIMLNEETAS